MKIISRKEAKAASLKRYYNGKPCKHGHVADRYVSGAQCTVCHAARGLESSRSARGRERHAEWKKSNSEKWLNYQHSYYKRHREQIRERAAEYRRDNIDKVRAYSRQWARDHSPGYRGSARACAYCETLFDSPRHNQRFCCRKCRSNDFYHKSSADLRDSYVRQVLISDGTLRASNIPAEIVRVKRLHLINLRLLSKRITR